MIVILDKITKLTKIQDTKSEISQQFQKYTLHIYVTFFNVLPIFEEVKMCTHKENGVFEGKWRAFAQLYVADDLHTVT